MKQTILVYILVIFSVLLSNNSHAQVDPREAKEHFKNKNYLMAIPVYEKLIKKDPEDKDYLFNLAHCYLNTNIDKTLAIPHLEKLITLNRFDEEAYLMLGRAYMLNYEFDKAIEILEKYKKDAKRKHEESIAKMLEDCRTAKELIKFPHDITFENLGEEINSEYPDYQPFVSKDESILVFTTRRKENKGRMEFDGYYPSDVWYSEMKDGEFTKARQLKTVNSIYDEQVVGMTDDGQLLFIYLDHIKEYGNIYYSEYKKGKYYRTKKYDESVNSDDIETSASISGDGNTLFFASNRKGGQGGLDLYMTRKLPTGDWAIPQNLGDKINTPYNEDFPTLSSDGKTLYFTSDGHPGMGGYDLYKSEWDPIENTWSEPTNLGYPLNTPDDDKTISFTEDGESAYISALRPKEGLGDLDIYRVIFNDIANPPAMYAVTVALQGSEDELIPDAFIMAYDENDEVVGEYSSNPTNSTYTIVLRPGKYTLEIETMDGKIHTENFYVTAFDAEKTLNDKKIIIPNQ